ncbi:hypothetical protein [Chengkuizengella marina]|uniref:Uncharacterized protein n=1 Tax=Chengkuizengella marina TaxID=2507566 RepID=A0A6N9Q8A0_9BACL|nr:hypothetical protein [Chengkuizengella marina]NBI30921.1 hypothetical protein [Chengkuizengella marina]
MGLNKGPFVVAQCFSVLDPYDVNAGAIPLPDPFPTETPVVVATVDVCVTQPQKTQVSLDSMVQIAANGNVAGASSASFEVTYELFRNNVVIATIIDEMDYVPTGSFPDDGRHTNFPNFPVLDNNPSAGINTYDLVCTNKGGSFPPIFAASRSLKATVFTL